ncbi:MAG: PAS domain S-box protein [Candidatus Methanoperedens sp.]|nr:PAS domain S-box protein [Candidatus Methanoperedens sp.]MCZ7369183.1 PAS domain S-box protein [Candidatus Methanoperedens sp.]
MFTDFFIRNLDSVFFIYGFAFTILGIIIFVQLRVTKQSKFRLLDILWLLAWFGFIHGISEFIDMFMLIKGNLLFLRILGALVLFISFLFLFLFGYRMINIGERKRLGSWFPFTIALLFFGLPAVFGATSFDNWNISSRYFLGFPGAILSAIGFVLYYKSEAKKLGEAKVKKYFILIALLFGLYAIFGGWVVPQANFYPASAINNAWFTSSFGIPVQIFRAMIAVGIAWSLWNIVNIFNVEETVEHRRVNEELRESEERYRKLVELSPDAISIHSEGKIVFINAAGAKLLGAANPEQLIGKPVMDFVHPDYRDIARERIQLMGEEGKNVSPAEQKFIKLDGSVIDVEVIAMPFTYQGKSGIQVIIRDITEHKMAEEALIQSEEKYRMLIDNIQDGVFIIQGDKIQFANEAFAKVVGYTVQEVIGKDFRELVAPEDLKIVADHYHRRQAGEDIPREYEFHMLHKDGRNRMLVNMNVGLITFRGGMASMGTVKDITEKKKLESQLLRAQRMDSIGTLASGIAHDINNVLTPIMLSQELLQEKFTDEESHRLLNAIERSTQRGASLMKQVMSYARGVEGERNALQIAHLISEIRQIAKETFPRNIEIRTDIPKDLWNISGDATQLHQVLMNLCVNARDAMPDGGILRISAENLFIDEDYAHINNDAKVGPYIVVTVSDTGTGISPGILDRIFEPFFTTKEHGKGTGLGLSTALGIMKSHGGFITVYSEIGKGSVFKVYLPAITTTETLKAQQHQHELPVGHGESILVVDDEDQILELTRKTLETHGYRVITANNGEEAIALYKQNREIIKLVLMDMMMPVMEGQESIRIISGVNPEVKIIAVSGLAEKDKLKKIAEAHVNAFLPKPYTAEKLLKTIHEVIGAKHGAGEHV